MQIDFCSFFNATDCVMWDLWICYSNITEFELL